MVQNEVISAELILAMPAVEEALMTRLFELPPPGQRHMYMPLFDHYMELRPSAEIRGYIRKDLWDRFEARREPAPDTVLRETPRIGTVTRLMGCCRYGCQSQESIARRTDSKRQDFSHEAMASVFQFSLVYEDADYTHHAALAALPRSIASNAS
jgi:hypothetical protein